MDNHLESSMASVADDLSKIVEVSLIRFGKKKQPHFYKKILAHVEKPILKAVLLHTVGNQSEAARVLGISRGCLLKKLCLYRMI